MRPMKLAGSELMFGYGSLEYIKSIKAGKAAIVIGGSSMEKNGILNRVKDYLTEAGMQTIIISGVEPDPSFATVMRGAKSMLEFETDLIVALGGGSAMDAAKAMWIFYEHPELQCMEDILPPQPFPSLRKKARLCCIPSTSGTASEVSRSIVISSDEGIKQGLGNMEMMPDIAICDPEVTLSMPPKITAETGMDALTHALEALVSTRANYLSNILAAQAVLDITEALPQAYQDGEDRPAREKMLLASMLAGMAFTNVSLGIVHSMAHTVGSLFHIAHGLADAILLPYVIRYNQRDQRAAAIYQQMAQKAKVKDMIALVKELNSKLGIPDRLSAVILDQAAYEEKMDQMIEMAKNDGCTKTNPIIPSAQEWRELFTKAYKGE